MAFCRLGVAINTEYLLR